MIRSCLAELKGVHPSPFSHQAITKVMMGNFLSQVFKII